MNLSSFQDVLYLVGAICLVWITVFLCWALYQIGKLVHQANDIVEDTRETVEHLEKTVLHLGERLSSTTQYLGLIAEGGKQIVSFLGKRSKKKKGKLSDMEEE